MKFYASGKLLLFGEYLVLRGAECLAIPLKYGQALEVKKRKDQQINWISKTDEHIWFSGRFYNDHEIIETSDIKKAMAIRQLLMFLKSQNKSLFQTGLDFETVTDFPTEWGFGTSSTLVNLLAQWSGVNAHELLENSFGGSGYDVACASAETPILYKQHKNRIIPVQLSPNVTSKILFVYSGKKQETKSEIKRFETIHLSGNAIEKKNKIVEQAAKATDIETFERCMTESEKQLSEILERPTIKSEKFNDYPFAIKSLGAWGGDFFMATYRDEEVARKYFNDKEFQVHFRYNQLIKR